MNVEKNGNLQDIDLVLDDLELDDIKIDALQAEESKGLPEMGATLGVVTCCSCCCCTT